MTDSPRTSRQERKIHVQAALSLLLPAPGAARWGWQVRSLSRGLGSRLPAQARSAEPAPRRGTGRSQRPRRCSRATASLSPLPQPGAPGGGSSPAGPAGSGTASTASPRTSPAADRPRDRAPAAPLAGREPDRDAGREPEWDAGREADGDGRREPDRDAEPRPLSRPAGSGAEQAAERGRERAPLQRHLSSLLLLLPSPPFSSLLLLLPSPPFSSPFPLARRCQPRGATAVPCRGGNGDPGQVTPSLCRGWEGCGSR